MSARPADDGKDLPFAAIARMDELCDQFEAAWRSGQKPELESYLGETEEPVRRRLLGELLGLDLEFQFECSERPNPATYLARFPGYSEVIDEVFTRFQASLVTRVLTTRAVPPNPSDAHPKSPVPGVDLHPGVLSALRNAGYEVQSELGHGGMGIVYLATKVALNRPCALKMILAGAQAGSRALTRFRAEAEAIARVRHPAIVQIFHVGEVEGLPFIELEYLPGGSLDRKLDGTPWIPSVAAEFVQVVSRAIAEAHRRGVLHRDLKPANILLDGDGHPKVADFGLAKILDSDVGITRTQSIIGSPCYMSPEQAEGRTHDVGPATDVYALGAVLYELLTGRPPFRSATPLETLSLIKSADPVSPSRLQPGLKRDIETICLKCLDKVPSRRYAGASDLADDLNRFLAGEPILARPVPVWERTWRSAARAPAISALILMVVMVTAVGFSMVFWQWRRAETARLVAVKNLDDSEANYELAHEAVERYFTRVSEERLLNEPQMTPLRMDLLRTAREFYQEFVNRRAEDPKARADLGAAYNRLSTIDQSMMAMDKVEANSLQAKRIFSDLMAEQPGEPAYRRGLARSENNYGVSLFYRGRKLEALAAYNESRKLRESLFAAYPTDGRYRDDLASTYYNVGSTAADVGKLDEAEASLLRARDLWGTVVLKTTDASVFDRYRANLANTDRALCSLYATAQKAELAEKSAQRALAILEPLVAAHPGSVSYRRTLAVVHADLAHLYSFSGPDEAFMAHLSEAIKVGESIVASNPDLTDIRADLAIYYLNHAIKARDEGRLELAETSLKRTLELHRALVADRPEIAQFQSALANAETTLDILRRDTGHPSEAEAASRRALGLRERLVAEHPEIPDYLAELGFCLHDMGNIAMDAGRTAEADALFARALKLYDLLVSKNANVPQYRMQLGRILGDVGLLHLREGRMPEALASLGRSHQVLATLVAEYPTIAIFRADLGHAAVRLALATNRSGHRAAALPLAKFGVETLNSLPKPSARYVSYQAKAHAVLGSMIDRDSHDRKAVERLRVAIESGYRNLSEYRRDPLFDSMRSRPDFEALMLDLSFPADPFARSR